MSDTARVRFPVNSDGARICNDRADFLQALADAYEAVAAAKAFAGSDDLAAVIKGTRKPRSVHGMLQPVKGELLQLLQARGVDVNLDEVHASYARSTVVAR